jgi:hypothetical protein
MRERQSQYLYSVFCYEYHSYKIDGKRVERFAVLFANTKRVDITGCK